MFNGHPKTMGTFEHTLDILSQMFDDIVWPLLSTPSFIECRSNKNIRGILTS